jgi:LacI family transcriptional regulator
MKDYVTLRDIAKKAKLSVNSVSRALNDHADIGARTKERVRRIAEQLGYIPHSAAAHLRSGDSRSIGVILTHIDNSFFARILQGINDCVSAHGYTVVTLASNEDPDAEERSTRLCISYRVSGMLIVPARNLQSGIDYTLLQVPHIQIVRRDASGTGAFFISDSRRGGQLAAERLIGIGRRRLGYLGFDMPVSCNRDRMRGYSERIRKQGLAFDRRAVRLCEATTTAAFQCMKEWIGEGFRADGLFVYNDEMAFGAIRALADAGIRVPRDVSVVGHDDIEIAQSYVPRLTTVQVPKYRLGFESARSLLQMIEAGERPAEPLHTIYGPDLIIRET